MTLSVRLTFHSDIEEAIRDFAKKEGVKERDRLLERARTLILDNIAKGGMVTRIDVEGVPHRAVYAAAEFINDDKSGRFRAIYTPGDADLVVEVR